MNGQKLLDTVLSNASESSRNSRLHGPDHWAGVAAVGLRLLDSTSGADPSTVLAFCVLHDSQRHSDGRDEAHGERAATFARILRKEGALALEEERMGLLERALRLHDTGEVSQDPTIGACWDADRLTLPRVGIKPRPEFMSTQAGRSFVNNPHLLRGLQRSWRSIFADFEAAGSAHAS